MSAADDLEDVLHDARVGMFAGQVRNPDALERAIRLGLVERYYEGPAGFLGLARLRLVQEPSP